MKNLTNVVLPAPISPYRKIISPALIILEMLFEKFCVSLIDLIASTTC